MYTTRVCFLTTIQRISIKLAPLSFSVQLVASWVKQYRLNWIWELKYQRSFGALIAQLCHSVFIDPPTRAPPTRPSVCDPTTEWTCGDGTCVDKSGRCDRTKYDCVDGTDEYDCGLCGMISACFTLCVSPSVPLGGSLFLSPFHHSLSCWIQDYKQL